MRAVGQGRCVHWYLSKCALHHPLQVGSDTLRVGVLPVDGNAMEQDTGLFAHNFHGSRLSNFLPSMEPFRCRLHARTRAGGHYQPHLVARVK